MAELILVDYATQKDIGRQVMQPQERYRLYADCREHELLTFQQKRYTIDRLCWNPVKEAMLVQVTFHSPERLGCGCAVGCCTCC